MTTNHAYGWLPQLPDQRDHRFNYELIQIPLPHRVDMSTWAAPVYDQGQLGSCVANAVAAAVEFDQHRQGVWTFMPSRLFIYYNGRVLEGTVASDSGLTVRDGIKVITASGVCPEYLWTYDISKFTVKPPQKAYDAAVGEKAVSYKAVPKILQALKTCIAAYSPFVFGFTVYESFESAEVAATGIVPLPGPGEAVLGGHCMMVVGYDDPVQQFIVRNSWGTSWGQEGYCRMPYAYLLGPLASDFWSIKVVSADPKPA